MKKVITTFIIVAIVVSITMYHQKHPKEEHIIERIELIDVDGSLQHDEMEALILPYKTIKDENMNVIIGEATNDMVANIPESELSNLVADVLLYEARRYVEDVDIAVTNMGGIRRPLFKGNITVGDIYEILPFDNSLLILEYKAEDIIALANAVAQKGGDAISGMSLTINDGIAEDIKINGEEIDSTRTYKVISTDYLSWGNDQLDPLANHISSLPLNMMMRDAMFDYITNATANEQKISSKLDNRIILKQ